MDSLHSSFIPREAPISEKSSENKVKIPEQEAGIHTAAKAAMASGTDREAVAPLAEGKVDAQPPAGAEKVAGTAEQSGVLPLVEGKPSEKGPLVYILRPHAETEQVIVARGKTMTPEQKEQYVLDRYANSDYEIISEDTLVRQMSGGVEREYKVHRELGAGQFSTIVEVKAEVAGKKSKAVKFTSEEQGQEPSPGGNRTLAGVYKQLYISDKIKEQHITGSDGGKVKGLPKDPKAVIDFGDGTYAIVLSKADSDLVDYCGGYEDQGKPFPPKQLFQALDELSEGLATMHEVGVVHRDLKLENVLVSMDRKAALGAETPKSFQWTDFDGSQILSETSIREREVFDCTPGSMHPKDIDLYFRNPRALRAMDEEAFAHSAKSHDVYSFAVVLLKLPLRDISVMDTPPEGSKRLETLLPLDAPAKSAKGEGEATIREKVVSYFEVVVSDDKREIGREVGREYVALIEKMISPDFQDRPTAREVQAKIVELKERMSIALSSSGSEGANPRVMGGNMR